MLFTELALQNVRGFSPSARVALKPGYVTLRNSGNTVAPLSELLSALLYNDGRGADVTLLAPGQAAGKAGLIVQGKDKNLWRVLRQLGAGGSLHRQIVGNPEFVLVAQAAGEISQNLRGGAGVPTKSQLEQFFTLSFSQVPTERTKLKAQGPVEKRKKVISLRNVEIDVNDKEAIAATLASLEEELALAQNIGRMQSRQDELQAEIYQLEQKVGVLNEMREKVAQLQEQASHAPTPESLGLPPDIVDRARRYADEKASHNEAMRRLKEEKTRAEAVDLENEVLPIHTDRNFLMGIGIGILTLVLGVVLPHAFRYVALLSTGAFGYAAVKALQYIDDLKSKTHTAHRAVFFSEREKKLTEAFESIRFPVEKALEVTGQRDTEMFIDLMGTRFALESQVQDAAIEFSAVQEDPEMLTAVERFEAYKQEIQEVEAQLSSTSGGYVRDQREIERDIAKLNSSFEEITGSGLNQKIEWVDPTPALLTMAADMFGMPIAALWAQISDRATQYVTALTERRCTGLVISATGECAGLVQGHAEPLPKMLGKDADLAYLALRLTLVEKYSSIDKIPLIIEGDLGIETAKWVLLVRMLKHVGSLTQVLHVSTVGQNLPAGDLVIPV